MKGRYLLYIFLTLFFLGFAAGEILQAQPVGNRFRGMGGRGAAGGRSDSLTFEKRNALEDSITVRYRKLDTVRFFTPDSSVSDFFVKFPLQATSVFLGNIGTAERSILFQPIVQPGWDPGFHAYNVYAYTKDDTRFYTTTRPYTELGYNIGNRAEQVISLLHTQNIKPDWNATAQYRLVNSPGFFKSQNTNHSALRLSTWFDSKDRRYHGFAIYIQNSLQSAENGGIVSDTFINNKNPAYDDLFNIPTNLGGDNTFSRDFFNTSLRTGNKYKQSHLLYRHQYDLGQKDSVVTDSSVIRLFYPRIRFEHTLEYGTRDYYHQNPEVESLSDSSFYALNYGLVNLRDTFRLRDEWREFTNDFSFYTFPNAKNQLQFVKLGAAFQMLRGTFDTGQVRENYNNLWLHGEYRNRTRNQKWDVGLYGSLYLGGLNSGDFTAGIQLKRTILKPAAQLSVGFRNTNRTPGFVFDSRSTFQFAEPTSLGKENITVVDANLELTRLRLLVFGRYYVVGNYTYLRDFYTPAQASDVFTLLQVGVSKRFHLGRKWYWYLDAIVQQRAGEGPVNVPLLFTRNRITYENLLFRNLHLSTGLDLRYHTAYTADNYSPVLGKFFPQDSVRISNRPDVTGFVHLRIRSFTAYVRAENLNSFDLTNGPGFTLPNQAAPLYSYPTFIFRVGIYWNFVN